jgi:transposase
MTGDGTYQGHEQFPTSESELIPRVASIEAREKHLAVEASSLSRWAARTLEAYVDRVLVCDPRENHLISRDARKSDKADAYNLCRLLRLGELQKVYQAEDDHRAVFKTAAQHYLDCRDRQAALKQKIKAAFRRWGILDLEGQEVYSKTGRSDYLEQISQPEIARQLKRLYRLLDQALQAQGGAKKQMVRLGERYPEIERFQEVPGIGPIGSHLFDAFVQTPHRFSTRQKLWRYCQLSVRSQTSDGGHLDGQSPSDTRSLTPTAEAS